MFILIFLNIDATNNVSEKLYCLLISGLEIRNYSIISNLDANKTNILDFSWQFYNRVNSEMLISARIYYRNRNFYGIELFIIT